MKNALISNRFIGFIALIFLFILCFFRAPTPGLNWLLYGFGALVITALVTESQNLKSLVIPGYRHVGLQCRRFYSQRLTCYYNDHFVFWIPRRIAGNSQGRSRLWRLCWFFKFHHIPLRRNYSLFSAVEHQEWKI